jgi:hypothetical protein
VAACAWALAGAGCTRSLADAACPCLAGWSCCMPRNICVLSATECTADDSGSTDDGATTDGGGSIDSSPAPDDGPAGAGSDAPLAAYGCATMGRFTADTQVLDGVGDEFADITPVTFRASDAPWTDTVPPPDLPETITFRAAWSPDGFHLHVHVDDPTIIVNPELTNLWDGDGIEVLVANSNTFSGRFDGTNDGGAIHVGLVPPSGYAVPRGVIYVDPVTNQARYELAAGLFAGRQVTGGYELELYLPWAPDTTPLVPGGSIGFQLAINAQDVPTPAGASMGRQLQGTLPWRAVDPPGCGFFWCDDRTWCRPTLE